MLQDVTIQIDKLVPMFLVLFVVSVTYITSGVDVFVFCSTSLPLARVLDGFDQPY